jgi:hypothetical protein
MIEESTNEVLAGFFNNFLAASLLMFGLVMAFNLFSDALQDALDPRKVGEHAPLLVLRVRDLVVEFPRTGRDPRRRRRQLRRRPGDETVGPRRRVRLRQDGDGAVAARARAEPPGRSPAGRIELGGRDLLGSAAPEMRGVRGRDIAMIFQEPMTALNPVFTVGSQMTDVLRRTAGCRGRAGARRGGRPARAPSASRTRTAPRRLPAPAVRRHAPARDDRHGAVVPARAAGGRRADHGPRRHHPGAGARARWCACSRSSARR